MGLGHILRPPNFTMASTACLGKFVSELSPTVLTHDTAKAARHGFKLTKLPSKNSATREEFLLGGSDGA